MLEEIILTGEKNMQVFQNLRVWQAAHACVLQTYRATNHFPKHEQYGMTSQIRRAAASVTANLAEGCGRGSNKDFGRFIQYALSSCCEWENFLMLARDLNYLQSCEADSLCQKVQDIRTQLLKLKDRVDSKQTSEAGP